MKAKTKPFSRLSAAAKRIAIAEDILKQIQAERYHVTTGHWLSVAPVESVMQEESKNSAKILQNALLGGKVVLEASPATCTCCAVGAACASAIRLFNQDTLCGNREDGFELNSYRDGVEILQKYFPKSRVDLMEAAFEMRSDTHLKTATEQAIEEAIEFGERYGSDTQRLQEICKNIIKNNGTFKP